MIREITVHGKYTFRYNEKTAEFTCLRNGTEWRDFIGDKAVFALFESLERARERLTDRSAVTLTIHEMTKKENEELKDLLSKILVKVNLVTSYHRHGQDVPSNFLDQLSNRQVEIEEELEKKYK